MVHWKAKFSDLSMFGKIQVPFFNENFKNCFFNKCVEDHVQVLSLLKIVLCLIVKIKNSDGISNTTILFKNGYHQCACKN